MERKIIMKETNNQFKIKPLLMDMYKKLEDNNLLTIEMDREYRMLMNNYHKAILEELNQSLMLNSEQVRRYEAI